MFPVTGTGVALVTPFTEALTLDLPALRRVVHHVVSGGVEALVPLGTTGESTTLSLEEQYKVLDVVFEVNAGKLPVWVGCGGNDTRAVAARMAELSARYPQATGFLSVSPAYNKPTQEGIVQHYRQLCSSTDKPILLYNVPGRTATNLLPETCYRLAADCPQVVGIKEASGNLDQNMDYVRLAPAGFSLLSGDDHLALAQVALGFTGLISVVGNVAPAETATLVRAALAGELARARNLQYRLLPLIRLLFAEGNPAGAKAALSVLGLCEPYVRLPLVPASPKLRADLTLALRAV
ncbi:MAG: 4-hydroxy-tetrahydrodipicolinate synthase [Bacteroidia bacterium]|nr:4-hydroxy-tetrahydrodipicolinate synthase [Bacteroidia bacterium]